MEAGMGKQHIAEICKRYDITEADIQSAVDDVGTYVDVSREDLGAIYRLALQHVHQRIELQKKDTPAVLKSSAGMNIADMVWAALGTLVGIGLCAVLSALYFEPRDMTLLIGSFGASAVLVYGAVKSPLAQPRNLVGGHVLSAIAGVFAAQLFSTDVVIAAPVAVALAIVLMMGTRTLHPPGGATALIAVIGGEKIRALGFLYPIVPVAAGALVLLAVALAVNNLSRHRKYPESW